MFVLNIFSLFIGLWCSFYQVVSKIKYFTPFLNQKKKKKKKEKEREKDRKILMEPWFVKKGQPFKDK